ncbi:GvpL/GvpF family gas vesicle protein [Patescibacteria group bacterium]|nr:GvpL/GvpF family gas vesicle protein [Patescibacteria group bacterium]
MKGFYLYCIREKSDSKFSTQGIDGGEIWTVPYQDLEAVVSEVSSEEFGSEEIQKKAQEDLGWIKEKALIHQSVVQKAMEIKDLPYPLQGDPLKNKGLKSVIPMKFGTIFKTRENLEATLKKHYSQFEENLKNLIGKQEWGVKVYLNRKAFEKEIKRVSPVVQEKEKEIAKLPEGMAYFMQKQIDEAASKEADNALENYTERFFENLKKCAAAGTKGKILEKELTGKSLPMAFNMIFLVSEEKLENFIKEIDKLNQEYKPKGFNFQYSGPWPPYNFVM